jgi:hypothetical protein
LTQHKSILMILTASRKALKATISSRTDSGSSASS